MTSITEFDRWLLDRENESLECKEAKYGYDEGELMEYCAAIANGNGGKFILGVDASHNYYKTVGLGGLHTRLVGISRDSKKQLILNHLQKNGRGKLDEFAQAFPDLPRTAISALLKDLRNHSIYRIQEKWLLGNVFKQS